MFRRLVLVLATSLGMLSQALASEGPDARLTWRLGFGGAGQSLQSGYGLALDYRSVDPDSPATQFLELDVSDRAAFARLAGLPLFERNYQSHQNEGDALPADSGSTPWYSHKWVMWTVGGLAATAALAGAGGGTDLCTGCYESSDNTGASVSGSSDDGTGCVNDDCALPCNPTTDPAGCIGFTGREPSVYVVDYERDRWLDAGTGQMGDLIAR